MMFVTETPPSSSPEAFCSPSSPVAMNLPSSSSSSTNADLLFQYKDIQLTLSIPAKDLPLLQSQKDEFLRSLSSSTNSEDPCSASELALEYLEFAVSQPRTSASALGGFLCAFRRECLGGNAEIHSLVAALTPSPEKRQRWLRAYYLAIELSSDSNPPDHVDPTNTCRSAFFYNAQRNVFQVLAVFGGQGDESRTCIQELIDLYTTYTPMLCHVLRRAGSHLYEMSTQLEPNLYFQGRPIDIDTWVNDTTSIPDTNYVSSAPVSMPIIGLLSLARYAVACHVLGFTPGELRASLQAATGHSQGLLVAIAIAMSDDWESFYKNVNLVVEVLFWLGLECHRNAPRSSVPTAAIADSNFGNQDELSYMLSVRGLKKDQMDGIIDHMNMRLSDGAHLQLALINARDQFVVAGPVASLIHLNSYLTTVAGSVRDQSRIPSSRRKLSIQHNFLPISTPFHTHYLRDAAESLKCRFAERIISPEQLMIPVYHTRNGRDLRGFDGNLLHIAFDAISRELCDWTAALNGHSLHQLTVPSHIVVFDRGGMGPLVKKIQDGQGIRVIQGSDIITRDTEVGTIQDLYSPILLESSTRMQSWGQRFKPCLATGETVGLKTRLSRLLGTPPVIVAGMTPTTMHWDFVSTIMDAGYHVELAGGGYRNASDMGSAILKLASTIAPGRGITCNIIYANPRAVQWQIALLRRLSHNDVPIDGLTIGAGVPSPDVVTEYIQTLKLRHISFKPGSMAAIKQVVDIAKAHPDFPIILQWTGGRGGGHHSFEDFHSPILSTYGIIRQQSNIYLVAGSGFGNAESIYPYITGAWSVTFGYPSMPFDGVLLGSRMMVAREAHTSPAVKRLIANTPGISDCDWEKTYDGPAGGVITVQSEMGEPIHKIANRGVLLWADLDKTVFSLPRKDRMAYLTKHRDSIICRLNADFAKPWFGRSSKGDNLDLEDMTYAEVLARMIKLLYIGHQRRWIDPSYIDFTLAIASRTLERLPHNSHSEVSHIVLEEDPERFLKCFLDSCPASVDYTLNPEDVSFFLIHCKKPGQKPVNFIPALNEDFELYFKKDSLWQSEDIEAVVQQDAERVCILHGPVAAQYSSDEEESAKEILDEITYGLIHCIQRENPAEQLTSDPNSGVMTPDSWSSASTAGRYFAIDEISSIPSSTTLSDSGEDHNVSFATISLELSQNLPLWASALLGERYVLQDRVRKMNPFRQALESCPNSCIKIASDRSEVSVAIHDTPTITSSMTISCHNGINVVVQLFPPGSTDALELLYRFAPNLSLCGLSEIMENRNKRIKSFYSRLWFSEDVNPHFTVHDTFQGPDITLTKELLEHLINAVGPAFPDHRVVLRNSPIIPISLGIVISWDVISRPLVLNDIDGDLLRLVHLSNTFEYSPNATPLMLGDTVTSESQVQAVYIEDGGKVVVVEGRIFRLGKPVMTVTSSFLCRGSSTDVQSTFRHKKESKRTINISSELDEKVLRHREWFHPDDDSLSLVGKFLIFDLQTHTRYMESGFNHLHVIGTVNTCVQGRQLRQIGIVEFKCDKCTGNPVLDFLDRRRVASHTSTELKCAGWSGLSSLEIQMPPSNNIYAQVSKDFNPIHVSTIFAKLAQLPGTLCHGMSTSAIAATVLELLVLEGDRARVRRYGVKFTGMVMPLEKLVIQLKHVGMVDGRMRFTIQALRKDNEEKVLEAEAEVEQPATAYLFTGQGSQCQGMGMDLYKDSPVAQALWDEIDAYLYDTYGWSILNIVRNNPKQLIVHFGGKRGRKVRQNYLSITAEVELPDGNHIQKPVLAGLSPASMSYTFSDSRGLLYATQFAQPAILLYEAAVFAEMRSRGYISQQAIYAGHSLGEFGALAALSEHVPTSTLTELCFYRGLMMHAAMQSDNGGATYGMVAANPKRMGNFFHEDTLSCLVRIIATESQDLLEIVNFNVDGEQYVCAGTISNIYVLGKVMDHIAQSPDGPKQVQKALESMNKATDLHNIISNFIAQAKALRQPIQLQRGKATIPLPGIDVPFHSSHLRPTVQAFRNCLLKPGFFEGNVDCEALVGRYIPNVMAKPFSLDEEYIKEAFDITQSPILGEILGI